MTRAERVVRRYLIRIAARGGPSMGWYPPHMVEKTRQALNLLRRGDRLKILGVPYVVESTSPGSLVLFSSRVGVEQTLTFDHRAGREINVELEGAPQGRLRRRSRPESVHPLALDLPRFLEEPGQRNLPGL